MCFEFRNRLLSKHHSDANGYYIEADVKDAYSAWMHNLKTDTDDLKTIFHNIVVENTIASYPVNEYHKNNLGDKVIEKDTLALILAQVMGDSAITADDAKAVIDEVDTTGENCINLTDFINIMTYVNNT